MHEKNPVRVELNFLFLNGRMKLGDCFLYPRWQILFLNGPGIFFQMQIDIITVAAIITHIYMIYWPDNSITLSEIEFP
jgi:hypothetical protein